MKIWPLLVSLTLVTSVHAQTPYAGMQTRPIKALSDQQIADLKAGRGMGLALAAELNGYPGPLHVLELADKLDLSAEQRSSVQRLFDLDEGRGDAAGVAADRAGGRSRPAICQPHGHAGKPQDIHRSGGRNPGDLAGNPSEISPLDRRHPQPLANDRNMQNCAVMAAAMAAVIGAITSKPPGRLYLARQTDIVRNQRCPGRLYVRRDCRNGASACRTPIQTTPDLRARKRARAHVWSATMHRLAGIFAAFVILLGAGLIRPPSRRKRPSPCSPPPR